VSGSGISWAICKSAPRSRQITTPAPHHLQARCPSCHPTDTDTYRQMDTNWVRSIARNCIGTYRQTQTHTTYMDCLHRLSTDIKTRSTNQTDRQTDTHSDMTTADGISNHGVISVSKAKTPNAARLPTLFCLMTVATSVPPAVCQHKHQQVTDAAHTVCTARST